MLTYLDNYSAAVKNNVITLNKTKDKHLISNFLGFLYSLHTRSSLKPDLMRNPILKPELTAHSSSYPSISS